jgi:hypothetical protein
VIVVKEFRRLGNRTRKSCPYSLREKGEFPSLEKRG